MGALLFLSILITYFVTVTNYSQNGKPLSLVKSKNESSTPIIEEVVPVQEPEHSGPTPEELRLPKAIEPIWYNLTIRVYVPGFIEFDDPEKNLTFSSALMMKILVKEKTNKIELNSLGLDLPTDPNEYGILVEGINVGSFNCIKHFDN